MLKRFRVWLARQLIRDADLALVRKSEVRQVEELAGELQKYVDTSGALRSPHRTRSHRRVQGLTNELGTHANAMEVTP